MRLIELDIFRLNGELLTSKTHTKMQTVQKVRLGARSGRYEQPAMLNRERRSHSHFSLNSVFPSLVEFKLKIESNPVNIYPVTDLPRSDHHKGHGVYNTLQSTYFSKKKQRSQNY